MTPDKVQELETSYYEGNELRCRDGIREAIDEAGLAVAEWRPAKIATALEVFRWWAAEYEAILQRVHDEAMEHDT